MNIYVLKKKKRKISQHLMKIQDKKVFKGVVISNSHMREQELALASITMKIKAIREEREKKYGNR